MGNAVVVCCSLPKRRPHAESSKEISVGSQSSKAVLQDRCGKNSITAPCQGAAAKRLRRLRNCSR